MNVWVLSPVQLFLPGIMDCSPAGSSRQEGFQARTLEWAAISYSKGIFLTQGSNAHLQRLLEWQADSSPLRHLGTVLVPSSHVTHTQRCAYCRCLLLMGKEAGTAVPGEVR